MTMTNSLVIFYAASLSHNKVNFLQKLRVKNEFSVYQIMRYLSTLRTSWSA